MALPFDFPRNFSAQTKFSEITSVEYISFIEKYLLFFLIPDKLILSIHKNSEKKSTPPDNVGRSEHKFVAQ